MTVRFSVLSPGSDVVDRGVGDVGRYQSMKASVYRFDELFCYPVFCNKRRSKE